CGVCLISTKICSGKTAKHLTARIFEVIFVVSDAGGLTPVKEERAKSDQKSRCEAVRGSTPVALSG
ncbi:MAG: hypothetical protein J1E06_03600, partial [Acutalibacter sp.]|nr:hypothetical protein [Acutalibacter sp.]